MIPATTFTKRVVEHGPGFDVMETAIRTRFLKGSEVWVQFVVLSSIRLPNGYESEGVGRAHEFQEC